MIPIRNAFPGYRVFIFGYEVTEDVIDISIQNHDGRAPNTCTVQLVSPNNRYFMTATDIAKMKGDIIQDDDEDKEISILDDSPVKKIIVDKKRSFPNAIIDMPPAIPDFNAAPHVAVRYPFQASKPIFHPMDPIRVFERDPFNPNRWYHMFAGFLSDFVDTDGYNRDQILTITAEDPSKLLRYARITTNPGVFDIKQRAIYDSVVADIAKFTPHVSMFHNMNLPQILHAMLFGLDTFASKSAKDYGLLDVDLHDKLGTKYSFYEPIMSAKSSPDTKVGRRRWGCGHANLRHSMVFMYGADKADLDKSKMPAGLELYDGQIRLDQYQTFIAHDVKTSDLNTMMAEAVTGYTRDAKVNPNNIQDIIKEIGEHPEIYPVDGGRLIMLLPSGLGPNNNDLIIKEIIKGDINLNTEWTTRAELLYDVMERIEFSFYCSPRGDYIVEFPLIDFDPDDFGFFEDDFTIRTNDTISAESTFTDSKVMTQAISVQQIVKNWDNMSNALSYQIHQHTVNLWHLMPLFGVRQTPVVPKGYISTPDGAKLYGYIQLNKINADAYSSTMNILPRITAWLNRPFRLVAKTHVGTTKSVNHKITWGAQGDVSTTIGLYAMRGWDGETEIIDDGAGGTTKVRVYTPIGGHASRPFNYKTLFGLRSGNKQNKQGKKGRKDASADEKKARGQQNSKNTKQPVKSTLTKPVSPKVKG